MKRNEQVEGLRGILALVIVAFHVFVRSNEIYFSGTSSLFGMILSFLTDCSVSAFLLMSGFYLKTRKEVSACEYICHRLKRLYPTYFFCITLIFALSFIVPLPNRSFTVANYFQNMLFLNGYINGIPYLDGAHWYLTALLSAISVYAVIQGCKLSKIDIVYTLWLYSVFGFIFLQKILPDSISPVLITFRRLVGSNYVGIFVLGIYLRKIIDREKFQNIIAVINIISAIGSIYFFMGGIYCIAVCVAIVATYLVVTERVNVLEKSVFVKLGAASYPIYCIHQQIAFTVIVYLSNWGEIAYIIAYVVVCGLGIALSTIENKLRKR